MQTSMPTPHRRRLISVAIGLLATVLVVSGLATSSRLVRAGDTASPAAAPVAANLPGRMLFVRGGDIWHLVNGKTEPVTREGGWMQPQISPDGSRIAAVGMYASTSELFILEADGTGAKQITRSRKTPLSASDWAFYPHWSPDGQDLAYITDRASFYPMLWRMNADGTGARQVTFPSNGLDSIASFAWSPDGRTVAASRYNIGQPQIVLIDLARPAGAAAVTKAEGGAYDPSWSPDGQYLTYVARVEKRDTVFVMDTTTQEPPVAVAEGDMVRSPVWSPNGNEIAYIALTGGSFEIFSVGLSFKDDVVVPGKPSPITVRFGVDAISGLSWGS